MLKFQVFLAKILLSNGEEDQVINGEPIHQNEVSLFKTDIELKIQYYDYTLPIIPVITTSILCIKIYQQLIRYNRKIIRKNFLDKLNLKSH